MLKIKDSSRPEASSVSVRNAWCGRLAFFPSVVVRIILRVSAALRGISLDSGELTLNLKFNDNY